VSRGLRLACMRCASARACAQPTPPTSTAQSLLLVRGPRPRPALPKYHDPSDHQLWVGSVPPCSPRGPAGDTSTAVSSWSARFRSTAIGPRCESELLMLLAGRARPPFSACTANRSAAFPGFPPPNPYHFVRRSVTRRIGAVNGRPLRPGGQVLSTRIQERVLFKFPVGTRDLPARRRPAALGVAPAPCRADTDSDGVPSLSVPSHVLCLRLGVHCQRLCVPLLRKGVRTVTDGIAQPLLRGKP
jgi:hypothetical protein